MCHENDYVLPGLWNMHMHLSALLPDPNHIQDNELVASAVIRFRLNAMDGLRHGFTAIRSVGERSPEHALHQRQALKKTVEAGVKVVPGSDSTPVGEIGILEMEQFVLSGVSEMQTLIAATHEL